MKYKIIATALASLLAAASLPAHAGLIGMADLSLSNLVIFDVDNAVPVTGAQIAIIDGDRQSTSSATLSGYANASNSSALVGPVADANATASVLTGSPLALAGLYGTIENNSSTHVAAPTAFNYALGDSFVSGSAVAGGAAGLTRADTSITGPDANATANGNVQNSVSATAIFTALSTINAQFVAAYDVFMKTYIDAIHYGVNGSSVATAGIQFVLNVFDETAGTDLLNWSPTEFNKNFSTSTSNNGTTKTFSQSGQLGSAVVGLIGGHQYQLTITQNSTSSVRSVPEPASLALLGLGLAGLGLSRRRKLS